MPRGTIEESVDTETRPIPETKNFPSKVRPAPSITDAFNATQAR